MVSFNPLGAFRTDAPINETIFLAAREFEKTLPDVKPGDFNRIYLHWAVAGMCDEFADYSVSVIEKDGHYEIVTTHDLRNNARSTLSVNYAAGTYHRNAGSISISLAGMDGATPANLGPDPVTVSGLTWLCAATAACAKKYNIDISGLSLYDDAYYGEPNVATHAEVAHWPGSPAQYEPYFITDSPSDGDIRWDLSLFTPLPADAKMSFAYATQCGDALRALSHRYKVALL